MKTSSLKGILYNHVPAALICLIMTFIKTKVTCTSLLVPGQPSLKYVHDGDINIGGIISGMGYDAKSLCGDKTYIDFSFHYSESIAYAINTINQNSSLLPNISLGYAILDDCLKDTTAAIQAISFLKQVPLDSSSSTSAGFPNQTCPPTSGEDDASDLLVSYDVLGVIGCLRSPNSMAASLILGPAQVPLISFMSTSDVLSNKELYPYFLRVVPSDKYLVLAQIQLIRQYGWKYISVLYAEGSFGEMAFETLKTRLGEICIATSHKIYQTATNEDYLWIIKSLLEHKNARVVVVIADPPSVYPLMKATSHLGAFGWFIWITTDIWKSELGSVNEQTIIHAASGALVVGFPSTVSPDYNTHVLEMTPGNNRNPWFLKFWADTFNCSVSDSSCATTHTMSSVSGSLAYIYANIAYDAVLTYVNGVETVRQRKCPHATGSDIRNCLTGPNLLEALMNSSFYGRTGLIQFDEYGDTLAKLEIQQFIPSQDYRHLRLETVAVYNARTANLTYLKNISFDYLIQEGFSQGVPESVCSKPCGLGEAIMMKASKCCWECRHCRNNEILANSFNDCFPCPSFTWPDPLSNFTICQDIPPNFCSMADPQVIMCLALAALGVCGVAMVTGAYIRYGDASVIKASSRELSYLQLVAILTGYITIPVLSVKPTDTVCGLAFFLYCLSFTWLYAPLLVKAIRVYRIFESGKKSKARVKFISPKSQLVFASLLISVQVALCIAITLTYEPSASLTQASKTDKYVELSCDWSLPGLNSFLVYNIVLVFLCAVFAFKTRKLPDNFNDSRFVSLCVYTTLIIWAAFIPTYFTSERQFVKTLLLSLSLLVNHTVAMAFLYFPKIYAAVNHLTSSSATEHIHPTLQTNAGGRFLSGITMPVAGPAALQATAGAGEDRPVATGKPLHPTLSRGLGSVANLRKICPDGEKVVSNTMRNSNTRDQNGPGEMEC